MYNSRYFVCSLGVEGTLTIISDRRKNPPKGISGGGEGKVGRNYLVRNGETIELPSKVTIKLEKRDLVVMVTPGGGYGRLSE